MRFEKDIIDGHLHIYNGFDETGRDFFDFFDKLQSDTGLKGMSIASLTDSIYGGIEINIMSALYKLHNSTAYAYAGFVYPEFPVELPLPEGMDALTQYNELMEIGFDGIKILYKPDTQKLIKLPINHAFYEEMFAQAEKDSTPFLWHVADPEEFWSEDKNDQWSYGDGTYPTFRDLFEQVFDVLNKHPKLMATFAHFMFLSDRPEVLEYIFKTYKNVAIDITPGMEMYKNFNDHYDFYREFFEKYTDRILFGSDAAVPEEIDSRKLITSIYKAIATDCDVDMVLQNVKGLGVSEEACDKIFCTNFLKRNGESPKLVNKKALRSYVDKYMHLISNETTKEQILKRITKELL